MYSAVEAHFKAPRINSNCFELYVFDNLPDDEKITGDTTGILNVPAHDYFLRARVALKLADLSQPGSQEKRSHEERALAYLQMSSEAKPGYICATRFKINVAGRLGFEDAVEEMQSAVRNNPNLEHECPFLDPSYQSAEELVEIVARAQLHAREWAPLRERYQSMRRDC